MHPVARLRLLVATMLVGVASLGSAQSPDIDRIESDSAKREKRIQEVSDQLDADNVVPDSTLDAAIKELSAFRDDIKDDDKSLDEAVDGPRGRLNDLGPPPADGQPPETADLVALRKKLSDRISRLTGLIKRNDLALSDIDRLIGRIRDRQSARFISSIGERTISPFSPGLWRKAGDESVVAIGVVAGHFSKWWRAQRQSGSAFEDLILLAVGLAGFIGLVTAPRRSRWRRIEAQLFDVASPSTLVKERRVALSVLGKGLLTAAGGGLLVGIAMEIGLVSRPGMQVALRLWLGMTAVVMIWDFSRVFFSPRRPEWRLSPVSDRAAAILQRHLIAIVVLFAVDRVVAAVAESAATGNELAMAQAAMANSVFAVMLFLFLSPALWRGSKPSTPVGDGGNNDAGGNGGNGGNDDAGTPAGGFSLRYEALCGAGRVLAILIFTANALAFLRLANFVFHRMVLAALFLILIWMVRVIARWGIEKLPVGRAPDSDLPEDGEASSAEPLNFWLGLALDVNLLVLAVPGFLLIVGFDWLDLSHWIGLLGHDIHLGAVTVSFTNMLAAAAAFLLVLMVTRWATGFFDKRLLQRTSLHTGERNSITTLINYIGVVIAALVALSLVGVGLSRLAIVAGALSVGIGFGLQSIVNDFVSGLILLFERPIEIGDWVVVASGEGYVRKIGVRSTEIKTFDEASVIIPNSELVTSAVQNWFYGSRIGRVLVDVGVAHDSDPEQVRDLLLDCASRHAQIRRSPPPTVRWTCFGESSFDFELRAYVRDYSDSYTIITELRYSVFKAFADAGVTIPYPQRDLHIRPGGAPGVETVAENDTG